ncbi:MAG TPA: hypothetical protein VN802_01165 [Stellaceae bacterium]|nr:hypothetical protein [Stellaceae bacterium]
MSLTLVLAAAAARAACLDEIPDARRHLATLKDEAQRREGQALLDKAEKDAKAGRERLCIDALTRVQALGR